MKPVLVGMNNPRSVAPEFALYPKPKGCTGHRLWQMIHVVNANVDGLTYARCFDRRNVVVGEWDDKTARFAADRMKKDFREGSTVVLLGDKVRRVFGLEKLLIHPQTIDGVSYRQIPHPSGMNRFYNDPVCRELVGTLLNELLTDSGGLNV